MTLIRRSAGMGTILLSVLGLLLCLAGIVGVWACKSRLNEVGVAFFGTADEAFEFMGTRLDRVSMSLEGSRHRIVELSKLARQLETSGAEARKELEPLVKIVGDIFAELEAAEHWLESSQAVARGVNRMSEAIAASARDHSREESAGVTAQRVAEFSDAIADALARLDTLRQELITMRENRVLAREIVSAIITRVIELDGRLANLEERVDRFNTRVSTARNSCADLGRRIHWWINFAAVALALVLVWFAVSQVGMMKHAWMFARSPVTPA